MNETNRDSIIDLMNDNSRLREVNADLLAALRASIDAMQRSASTGAVYLSELQQVLEQAHAALSQATQS